MSGLMFHPKKTKPKASTSTAALSNPLLPGASNARVIVRPMNKPTPPPPRPAAATAPGKRKGLHEPDAASAAPAPKKARGSSAESSTPPPVRTEKKPPPPTARRASPPTTASESEKDSGKGKGKASGEEKKEKARRVVLPRTPFEPGMMRSYADTYGGSLSQFRTCFTNPADPSDTTFNVDAPEPPTARLELPARGAVAEVLLLAPAKEDSYEPLKEIEAAVALITEFYAPAHVRKLLGPNPDDLDVEHGLRRQLKRARTKRDGPAYLRVLSEINGLLRGVKYPPFEAAQDAFADGPRNTLLDRLRDEGDDGAGKAEDPWGGQVPHTVAVHVAEEAYQRVVPPHFKELEDYKSWSAATYGEMLPPFINRIVRETKLGPGELLVDLGAGVGNVLIQAALATGCAAYGVEIQRAAATVGQEQLPQARARAAAWGIALGELELEHGDMLTAPGVNAALSRARVVVCNNKMFSEELNNALKDKFLVLPDGAQIVSLQAFAPTDARLSARSRDQFEEMLTVKEYTFGDGDVSWTSNGGSWFIHTVDHSRLHRQEQAGGRSSRARR